jgi:hypothetical protein
MYFFLVAILLLHAITPLVQTDAFDPGDERPCQRCIKRGLADACQDGVRKKAKYLHDAPPEALRPVLGPNYNPGSNGRTPGQVSNSTTSASDTSPGIGNFFPPANNSPNYSNLQYQQIRHQQMPPPLADGLNFINQQSPISPNFASNMSHNSMQNMAAPMAPAKVDVGEQTAFTGALFDPSNPALFNFDLEGLNFGNHYGALEFGMLNHMSSGAAETPPQDQTGNVSQQSDQPFNAGGLYNSNLQYNQMYNQTDGLDFGALNRQTSSGNLYELSHGNHGLPRAYAIEAGPTSLTSPSTDAQASPQSSIPYEGSPQMTFNSSTTTGTTTTTTTTSHRPQQKRPEQAKPVPKFPPPSLMVTVKRARDTSGIYNSVTEPYSYTTGFHRLTNFIQKRFSPNATLKIAKSLASIRPSFISCTKTLNREDLIFMEKCFQRTLFEYEDFMRDCSTPTLVCRRSGEIAAVNKEFTLLTGWTKSVLLGREPNLNVNKGKSGSSAGNSLSNSVNNSGRAGLATPRLRAMAPERGQENRPTYVLLAELLDDDSVIEFYQDFARIAFGDSRGSVTKRCNLLKYQTKEMMEKTEEDEEKRRRGDMSGGNKDMPPGTMLGGRVSKIDGEWGIGRLERDGKMDCSYCWTVKRDVFDIPMLIVMNVSWKAFFFIWFLFLPRDVHRCEISSWS